MKARHFFVIGLLLLAVFVPSRVAIAQTATDTVCAGLGSALGGSGCEDPSDSPTLDDTVPSVINLLSLVVGVIAVFMLIVGALKFTTSQGDSGGVAGAKNTIVYAIIGLIIVALAQVIVQFVLQRSTDDGPVQRTSPSDIGGRDGPR